MEIMASPSPPFKGKLVLTGFSNEGISMNLQLIMQLLVRTSHLTAVCAFAYFKAFYFNFISILDFS